MGYVTVVFTNGDIVNFAAENFDADLTQRLNYVNKYPYTDAQGRDSFVQLKPMEVAGIFLTQSEGPGQKPIRYTVAGPT